MLEKLFEEGLLDYQKLLNKYYQTFNLSADEYLIMLNLLSLAERRRVNLSTNSIARLTGYKMNLVGEIINNLFEKEIINIELVRKNDGKMGEIFSLKPFFVRVAEILNNEINKLEQEKIITDQEYVINELEDVFGRALSPSNLEIIRGWFSDGFTKSEIFEAIEITNEHKRKTVNYVDRILRSETFQETSSLDEKTAEILRRLVGK